jgi:hypothetical protein
VLSMLRSLDLSRLLVSQYTVINPDLSLSQLQLNPLYFPRKKCPIWSHANAKNGRAPE